MKKKNNKRSIKKTITFPIKPKISLEERFKKYKEKNLAEEFEWDKSVGKEIW